MTTGATNEQQTRKIEGRELKIGYRYMQFVSIYKGSRRFSTESRGEKPARSKEKTLPTEKTLDDPSGIGTWPTSGFLLSRPTQKLWFIWVQPSWDPFCSRSDVSSLCWPPEDTVRTQGGHSGRIVGKPGGGSRTRVCGSACRSRRWRRPGSGGIPRNFSLRPSLTEIGSTRSRVG